MHEPTRASLPALGSPDEWCCKVITKHGRCGHTDTQPYFCATYIAKLERSKNPADNGQPVERRCMQYDRRYSTPTSCPQCIADEKAKAQKRRGTFGEMVTKGKEAIQNVFRKSDLGESSTSRTSPQISNSPSSNYSSSLPATPRDARAMPIPIPGSARRPQYAATPTNIAQSSRAAAVQQYPSSSSSRGRYQNAASNPSSSARPKHVPINSSSLAEEYQAVIAQQQSQNSAQSMTLFNERLWVDPEVLGAYEKWKRERNGSGRDEEERR